MCSQKASPLLSRRDILGAIQSELRPDEYITEFLGAGPKNYSFKTTNPATGEGKTVCKDRGVTLNYNASQLGNFDIIKEMIVKGDEERTVTVRTEKKIKRKRVREETVGLTSSPNPKTRYTGSRF